MIHNKPYINLMYRHIDYIISKAVSRLYFLKQLKRAGLPSAHLLHFYITVIRPYLNMPSRCGILLWPSLKQSGWRRFNVWLLLSFLVIPHLPLMLFLWLWLAFCLSMQDAWIIPSVFSETFVNPLAVCTISHHLEIKPWHLASERPLYTQGQVFAPKDTVPQSCMLF